jgi:hypothetical protein
MTREEFWAKEFHVHANELEEYDRFAEEEEQGTPEETAFYAAAWADRALLEYDKRFPRKMRALT